MLNVSIRLLVTRQFEMQLNKAVDIDGIAKRRASIKGVDIDAENAGAPEESDHADECIALTKEHLTRLPASQPPVENAPEMDYQNLSFEEQ